MNKAIIILNSVSDLRIVSDEVIRSKLYTPRYNPTLSDLYNKVKPNTTFCKWYHYCQITDIHYFSDNPKDWTIVTHVKL